MAVRKPPPKVEDRLARTKSGRLVRPIGDGLTPGHIRCKLIGGADSGKVIEVWYNDLKPAHPLEQLAGEAPEG